MEPDPPRLTGAAQPGQRATRRPSVTADKRAASAAARLFASGKCHVVALKASLSSTRLSGKDANDTGAKKPDQEKSHAAAQ